MSAAVSFVAPPPGFAPHTDFELAPVDDSDGLYVLRAVADTGLRVFLLDPHTVVDDYAPVLSDEQAEQLQLQRADDALVLVVANPTDEGVSVNLKAPVVVNTASGRSAQVILEDQDFPLRAQLG